MLGKSVVTCCRKSHYSCSCLGLSVEVIQGQDQWSAWCCLFVGEENICVCRLVRETVLLAFSELSRKDLTTKQLHFILKHRCVFCLSCLGCRGDALLR